jgi:hypothetical protein
VTLKLGAVKMVDEDLDCMESEENQGNRLAVMEFKPQ